MWTPNVSRPKILSITAHRKTPSLSALDVTMAALAAYRLTRLVVVDDFPPVAKARKAIVGTFGADSLPAQAIGCPWCSGVYVSAAVALAVTRWPLARRLALIPAFSAVVGLLSTLDSYLGGNGPTISDELAEALRRPIRGPGK